MSRDAPTIEAICVLVLAKNGGDFYKMDYLDRRRIVRVTDSVISVLSDLGMVTVISKVGG